MLRQPLFLLLIISRSIQNKNFSGIEQVLRHDTDKCLLV